MTVAMLFSDLETNKSPYITVHKSGYVWEALMLKWNPDGGFWEPYQSGIGFFQNAADAAVEAVNWAISAGVRYVEQDS